MIPRPMPLLIVAIVAIVAILGPERRSRLNR